MQIAVPSQRPSTLTASRDGKEGVRHRCDGDADCEENEEEKEEGFEYDPDRSLVVVVVVFD